MKTDKDIFSKSSAYEAGQAIQITIFKHGVTLGIVRQLRNIVSNHPDDILKMFFKGLLGVRQ